jgi:diaminopropionate ammonia-lyase
MDPGVRANPLREPALQAARLNFARSFHTRLPDAAPTPLLELRPLADELGLGSLLVKDESARLGLQGYEVLGAGWALYRESLRRLGRRPPKWNGVDELRSALAPLGQLKVVAATDGGFGAGVARAARLFGFDATVYLPATAAPERIAAVEREGARVVAVGTTWDDAMAGAATETDDDVVLLSESSWEGFDDVPTWVTEGYATVFEEVDDELEARGRPAPDAVVVPLGIGAFASAASAWYRTDRFSSELWLLGAEPTSAACWSASVVASERITLPATGVTVMEGLARGLPSALAWPVVSHAFDAVVAVDDALAIEAESRLATHGVLASPTGAAAFAGVLQALADRAAGNGAIPLGPAARVLVVITEGTVGSTP